MPEADVGGHGPSYGRLWPYCGSSSLPGTSRTFAGPKVLPMLTSFASVVILGLLFARAVSAPMAVRRSSRTSAAVPEAFATVASPLWPRQGKGAAHVLPQRDDQRRDLFRRTVRRVGPGWVVADGRTHPHGAVHRMGRLNWFVPVV